jgi:hypothetical protein
MEEQNSKDTLRHLLQLPPGTLLRIIPGEGPFTVGMLCDVAREAALPPEDSDEATFLMWEEIVTKNLCIGG